jgi:hypothetical protein
VCSATPSSHSAQPGGAHAWPAAARRRLCHSGCSWREPLNIGLQDVPHASAHMGRGRAAGAIVRRQPVLGRCLAAVIGLWLHPQVRHIVMTVVLCVYNTVVLCGPPQPRAAMRLPCVCVRALKTLPSSQGLFLSNRHDCMRAGRAIQHFCPCCAGSGPHPFTSP